MNGATTDPCARIKTPPKIKTINIIGKSQIFFRALRKLNISFKKSIFIPKQLKLVFE